MRMATPPSASCFLLPPLSFGCRHREAPYLCTSFIEVHPYNRHIAAAQCGVRLDLLAFRELACHQMRLCALPARRLLHRSLLRPTSWVRLAGRTVHLLVVRHIDACSEHLADGLDAGRRDARAWRDARPAHRS